MDKAKIDFKKFRIVACQRAYLHGKITEEQIRSAIGKGITQEEADEILSVKKKTE